MRVTKTPLLPTLLLLILAACAGEPAEEPAAAGPRVESPGVGVAIASLPADFRVAVNEGETLRLGAADGSPGVELEVVAMVPESGGINLVAASHDYKAEVEARGGTNYGADPTEYVSPLGTTFYNRASYPGAGGGEAGGEVEEMVVFTIHPWGDRKLKLAYRHPMPATPEGKQQRIDELMAVVGEIEGMPRPEPEPGPDSEPESGPDSDPGV